MKKFPEYQRLSKTQKGNVIRGVRRDLTISAFNEGQQEPVNDMSNMSTGESINPLAQALNRKMKKVQ